MANDPKPTLLRAWVGLMKDFDLPEGKAHQVDFTGYSDDRLRDLDRLEVARPPPDTRVSTEALAHTVGLAYRHALREEKARGGSREASGRGAAPSAGSDEPGGGSPPGGPAAEEETPLSLDPLEDEGAPPPPAAGRYAKGAGEPGFNRTVMPAHGRLLSEVLYALGSAETHGDLRRTLELVGAYEELRASATAPGAPPVLGAILQELERPSGTPWSERKKHLKEAIQHAFGGK